MSSPPPIRSKILRILLLPVLSLIVLWVFIAYSTIAQVAGIAQTQNRWQVIGAPIRQLIVEIQRERQFSAEAAGATAQNRMLSDQRRVTNGKLDLVRQAVASAAAYEPDNAPTDVRALVAAMDGLSQVRTFADSGAITPIQVTDGYNEFISVANRQFGDSDAIAELSSFRIVRGMGAYSTTGEFAAREHAVLTAAMKRGEMTAAEHAAFVSAMTSRRNYLVYAERDMGPELRAEYDTFVQNPAYLRFKANEDRIFSWNLIGRPPLDAGEWKRDAQAVLVAVSKQSTQELARATAKGDTLRNDAYLRVGLILGAGLLAIVLSILASYRFGRSLIAELKRLQASAVELAEVRLPRLVERLRRGDDVDPATEAPELAPANTAEVDRVVNAFSAVRRTAVEAAVGQATLRKGVGMVFLNLAWRNQALLHRQLTLLDTMERRVEEPEILEDLFKLDHLTTRMRRHAENLIILSDAAPARRWRDPVPIFDVVRSAVLEVEDYTRVTVLPMPQAPLLVGAAVTDVIHLIAELVENATIFSPPNTVVHVRSMIAANGFALEVEDRGLGLSQANLDELNAKLADPPEFDLADSDRLGLFVVARLAARHGIKVVLRPSPYDGTTAIVLLPQSLLATCEALAAEAAPRRARQGGAHAGGPVRALSAAPEDWPRALSGTEDHVVARAPETTSSWFPTQERREVPAPSMPVRRAVSVPDVDDDLDGLPMRVRQANLAPQLRQTRSPEQRDITARTPEELSNLMSSMQRGWQQGRSQAEQELDVWKRKDGHSDARPQI
ncbi:MULTISPECIES: sensor histidine kinase [unclassified Streptosporangium]|uniref:sensor histidine kinase n=1 Tax=unclassified Streptosporangium TaxID=2632669 RepID=UPI002E28CBCD|nr:MULTISPECIES: nitrate- and nitrite sensing domain-containing protein [unclassified Streptosporangium]